MIRDIDFHQTPSSPQASCRFADVRAEFLDDEEDESGSHSPKALENGGNLFAGLVRHMRDRPTKTMYPHGSCRDPIRRANQRPSMQMLSESDLPETRASAVVERKYARRRHGRSQSSVRPQSLRRTASGPLHPGHPEKSGCRLMPYGYRRRSVEVRDRVNRPAIYHQPNQ